MYEKLTAQQWQLLAKTWNLKNQIPNVTRELAELEQYCQGIANISYRTTVSDDFLDIESYAIRRYMRAIDNEIEKLLEHALSLKNAFDNPDLLNKE